MSVHVTLPDHGMIIAGLPYSFEGQQRIDEVSGCSPYGSSTITGNDGQRWPSGNERAGARFPGRYVAEIASKLVQKNLTDNGFSGHISSSGIATTFFTKRSSLKFCS